MHTVPTLHIAFSSKTWPGAHARGKSPCVHVHVPVCCRLNICLHACLACLIVANATSCPAQLVPLRPTLTSRMTLLDFMICVVAFFLLATAISRDRQQQLFNRHLRYVLLAPAHCSWRNTTLKLIELLLSWVLLPLLQFSMITLLVTNDLTSANILLNAVAIVHSLFVIQGPLGRWVMHHMPTKLCTHNH